MRLPCSRRRVLTLTAGVVLAAAGYATLSRLARQPWPLHDVTVLLTAAAALAGGLVLRFLGWRRLFAHHERPSRELALAAGAVSAVSSPAPPMKLDYALKVWFTRRFSRGTVGVEAGVVSLFALAMVDAAVLTVPAAVAAGLISAPAIRFPLIGVALVGAVFACLYLAAGRLHRLAERRSSARLARLAGRLGQRVALVRDNLAAYSLLSASLWLRTAGLLALLLAFGIRASIVTAIVYVCLTAGSAFVPIPSFTVGAGTAALAGLGVGVARAAAFGLALALLSVFAAAALAATVGAARYGRTLLASPAS